MDKDNLGEATPAKDDEEMAKEIANIKSKMEDPKKLNELIYERIEYFFASLMPKLYELPSDLEEKVKAYEAMRDDMKKYVVSIRDVINNACFNCNFYKVLNSITIFAGVKPKGKIGEVLGMKASLSVGVAFSINFVAESIDVTAMALAAAGVSVRIGTPVSANIQFATISLCKTWPVPNDDELNKSDMTK